MYVDLFKMTWLAGHRTKMPQPLRSGVDVCWNEPGCYAHDTYLERTAGMRGRTRLLSGRTETTGASGAA